jgi:hypothetical protein
VKDLAEDEIPSGSPSQQFSRKKNKKAKPKQPNQGDRFVPSIPDLESPIYGDVGDFSFQAQIGGDLSDGNSPESEVNLPGIPITHRDSADTLKGNEDEFNAEHDGRHSRQEVITSDSYESVDTLLGEEYQHVETDVVDVFDEEDGVPVIQKGDEVLNWDLGDVPGEESDVSGGDDELDGAGLQAVGEHQNSEPAYMELLPGLSEPPGSVSVMGTEDERPTDRPIKRGAGDRSGLNLEGLAQDTLTVDASSTSQLRRYSISTTVNYLQDDVSDALANLQEELDEGGSEKCAARFKIFFPFLIRNLQFCQWMVSILF